MDIIWRKKSVGVILFFLVIFGLLGQLPSESLAAVDYSNLLQKAKTEGKVNVLVVLEEEKPRKLLGNFFNFNRRVNKEDFAIQADNLGQKWDVENVEAFKTLPMVSMTVTEEGLTEIINLGGVVNIQESKYYFSELADVLDITNTDSSHLQGFDGSGVAVVVIDTGFDVDHPFIGPQIISEACYSNGDGTGFSLCADEVAESTLIGASQDYCNDPDTTSGCQHGTHVAGIAIGNNGDAGSPSGVGKGADLVAIKVFTKFDHTEPCPSGICIAGTGTDLLKGLDRVLALQNDLTFTTPIAVVNLSLGSAETYDNWEECEADNPALRTAFDNLSAAGIAVVASSGNQSRSNKIAAPACIRSVISVGATNDVDEVQSFSNSAEMLDLLAPGSEVRSSWSGGGYAQSSGTSMSAPVVSGAMAVIRSEHNGIPIADAVDALKVSGKEVLDSRNGLIKPRVDVLGALNYLSVQIPVVNINSGVKVRAGEITDTTVQVIDDLGILVEDVEVDESSEGMVDNFNCAQTSSVQVDCTLDIVDSGDLVINAIDSGGLFGSSTVSGYTVYRVHIKNVYPATNTVSIRNYGNEIVDISDWRLCSKLVCTDNGIATDMILNNGSFLLDTDETVNLTTNLILTDLDEVGADLALYLPTGDLNDTESLVDFVQWNLPNNGSEDTAVDKGIWTDNAFLDFLEPFAFNGLKGDYGVGFWVSLDVTKPQLVSFSTTKIDGVYGPNEEIQIVATYDEEVSVDSNLQVVLSNGSQVNLNTVSANEIEGVYIVGETGSGEDDVDLNVVDILDENVADLQENLQEDSILPVVNVNTDSNITIDTTAPEIIELSAVSDGVFANRSFEGDMAIVTVSFNENVSYVEIDIEDGSSFGSNSDVDTFSQSLEITDDFYNNLLFDVMAQDSSGNEIVANEDDTEFLFLGGLYGFSSNSEPVAFSTLDTTLLLGDGEGLMIGDVEDFISSDIQLSASETLNSISSGTTIGVSKEVMTMLSGDRTLLETLILLPVNRTATDASKYMVILPNGITASVETSINPPVALSSVEISGQDFLGGINIVTGENILWSDDTVEVCFPGSADSFGVSSADEVNVYSSLDEVNYTVDSDFVGKRFSNAGQFCGYTNHFSSFAATTATPTPVVSSSSGGGGGGGGGSSSRRYACSDNKDNDNDGLIDEDDPGCYTNGDVSVQDDYDKNDDDESNIGELIETLDNVDSVEIGQTVLTPELIQRVLAILSSLRQKQPEEDSIKYFYPTNDSFDTYCTSNFTELTRQGDVGDLVRRDQVKLIEKGFLNDVADGIFGPKSKASVVHFQLREGLTPDGIIGPVTRSALCKYVPSV